MRYKVSALANGRFTVTDTADSGNIMYPTCQNNATKFAATLNKQENANYRPSKVQRKRIAWEALAVSVLGLFMAAFFFFLAYGMNAAVAAGGLNDAANAGLPYLVDVLTLAGITVFGISGFAVVAIVLEAK